MNSLLNSFFSVYLSLDSLISHVLNLVFQYKSIFLSKKLVFLCSLTFLFQIVFGLDYPLLGFSLCASCSSVFLNPPKLHPAHTLISFCHFFLLFCSANCIFEVKSNLLVGFAFDWKWYFKITSGIWGTTNKLKC